MDIEATIPADRRNTYNDEFEVLRQCEHRYRFSDNINLSPSILCCIYM